MKAQLSTYSTNTVHETHFKVMQRNLIKVLLFWVRRWDAQAGMDGQDGSGTNPCKFSFLWRNKNHLKYNTTGLRRGQLLPNPWRGPGLVWGGPLKILCWHAGKDLFYFRNLLTMTLAYFNFILHYYVGMVVTFSRNGIYFFNGTLVFWWFCFTFEFVSFLTLLACG